MATTFGATILALAAVLLANVAVVVCACPSMMTLERAFPANHGVDLAYLRARDTARHRRVLQSSPNVIDFAVAGTYDPFLVGLYYTRVRLGTPPTDFYVQIDTGSDVLWVSCKSCSGCPRTSGMQIPMNFFNYQSSSTASLVSCSDQLCSLGLQSSDSTCANNNKCGFAFQYGDGSGASGYYVSDVIQLDVVVGDSKTSNSSASVVFGCGTSLSGDLSKSDRAVDGIFGFGQQRMSVISQLSSQGIAPKVFSHCLRGDDTGGGILVLGEIVEPNIVYSPLVPSLPHYNLNLLSISVNGQQLSIDSSVFATSTNGGTIVDSGTTLAYLAEAAYSPFVTAIKNYAAQSANPIDSQGNQCFLVTSSLDSVFPEVSFNFEGASMVLRPQDYLIQQNSISGVPVWCIGFQEIQGQTTTILGDLVLKDKIIIYDLANQRIGWTSYNCSMPVNVSATNTSGQTEYVGTGLNQSKSMRNLPGGLISYTLALLIHFWLLRNFPLS